MNKRTKEDPLASSETPFVTPTLAEVFIRQGHLTQGLAIYQKLLRAAPMNPQLQKRVAELNEELRRMEDPVPPSSQNTGSLTVKAAGAGEAAQERGSFQNPMLNELNRWLLAIRERKGHV